MRDILTDMVRQTKDLFDVVKVVGTATDTTLRASAGDQSLLLNAVLNRPERSFEGEFGIPNITHLDGLLSSPSYRGPLARFDVRREVKPKGETVTAFEFHDGSKGLAVYKTMAAALITERVGRINDDVPWAVTLAPSRARIAEFGQLARLHTEFSKTFRMYTDGGDLMFAIGDGNTATHTLTMMFEPGVHGSLHGSRLHFDIGQFLGLMKFAGAHPVSLAISDEGALCVGVQAPTGSYRYILRARARN